MTPSATLRFVPLGTAALAAVAGFLIGLPLMGNAATPIGICPNMDDVIVGCKSAGMDYQQNVRPDGCRYAECIAPGTCPKFTDEVRACKNAGYDYDRFYDERRCERAKCLATTTTTKPGECTMKWDEADRKIKNCEKEAGYEAVVRESATCLEFISCKKIGGTTSAGEVTCKKRAENGCTIIKCEDGFSWNSCNAAGDAGSSASVGPVTRDPCAEIQLKAKAADEAMAAKKRDPYSRNQRNALNQLLRKCRLENKVK